MEGCVGFCFAETFFSSVPETAAKLFLGELVAGGEALPFLCGGDLAGGTESVGFAAFVGGGALPDL